MISPKIDDVTAHGISLAQIGNTTEASRIFKTVIKRNPKNLIAWWWLGKVTSDQKERRHYLQKARSLAVSGENNLANYRALLHRAGTPTLSIYKVASNSGSIGQNCPICTDIIKVGEIVVKCPACAAINHADCWEYNAFCCSTFACEGEGLVNMNGPLSTESTVENQVDGPVVLGDQEIPEESPYASREEQESGFVNRLQQQFRRAVTANVVRQMVLEERAQAARAEHTRRLQQRRVAQQRQIEKERQQAQKEAEQRQQEIVIRTASAFMAGLLPGVLLAYAVYQSSQNWIIALYTILLTASSVATAASHSLKSTDRITSVIYWLLPKAAIVGLLYLTFGQWQNGLLAVSLAALGGNILERIFRWRRFYEQRGFIAYGTLAIVFMIILRLII